ncbi:RNA-directed DNA polymerase, eukaryota [Tanacetum coccineum]
MLLNVDQLQKQLDKDEFQEKSTLDYDGQMTDQFQKFINSKFTLDYDSQMTETYFVEYTGLEVQHFRDTLLQHLGNVKKSIAERTRSQRQYERSIGMLVGWTQKALRTDSTVQDDAQVRELYRCKADHLFFSCNTVQALWGLLARWCQLDFLGFSNIADWFSWLDSARLSKHARLVLEGIASTMFWSLWNFRNAWIFSSSKPKKANIWDSIVHQSFLWISSRNPKFRFRWIDWLRNPIDTQVMEFADDGVFGLDEEEELDSGLVTLMGVYRTKEDDVAKISTYIYVTNFPESTNAKELFHACKAYGHVVDSFIPNKRAKNGKRFGFVRFINVFDIQRLVGNLETVWINRHKLQANVARFKRSEAKSSQSEGRGQNDRCGPSFASVLQDSVQPRPYISPSPAMVLDDSCIVERVLEKFVMDKKKTLQHVGVSSWFHRVCNAQPDFVANERIVWVDIEGVPLHAWSRKTLTNICSKWGEMLEFEESSDDFFARKRICIKTKLEDNIVEKFKIIIRGKIFVIRAKELFVWSLVFNEVKEAALCSDDESLNGEEVHKVDGNLDGDNVVEQPVNEKEHSRNPFGIYGLMGKKDVGADISEDDKSIPYPPRFTPMNPEDNGIEQGSNRKEPSKSPNRSVCSRVVMDSHNTDVILGSDERGSGCSEKGRVSSGGFGRYYQNRKSNGIFYGRV